MYKQNVYMLPGYIKYKHFDMCRLPNEHNTHINPAYLNHITHSICMGQTLHKSAYTDVSAGNQTV